MTNTDVIEQNRRNAEHLWTCSLCGETIKVFNRARHLTGHD